jgi:hypothetical protein
VPEQAQVRWYNPALEDFEWREVPQSDEEALSLLEDSPYTPTCTDTYRQWRELRRASRRRSYERARRPRKSATRERPLSRPFRPVRGGLLLLLALSPPDRRSG